MSHYFINDGSIQDQETKFHFRLAEKDYELISNQGVFSKDKLDTGTKILLETIMKEETSFDSCLDLGCGIGVIGLVLLDHFTCSMTMIDVNERAVELSKKNIQKYHKQAHIYCHDGIDTGMFDCITLNPPIRAGKQVIYRLFDESIEHLKENGRFWIVMRKQHGAKSAMNYLEEKGCIVTKVCQDKGFWIIKIQKEKEC